MRTLKSDTVFVNLNPFENYEKCLKIFKIFVLTFWPCIKTTLLEI